MTDLRTVTVLGLMGRLNMLIDEGKANLTPGEVQRRITDGTILDHLCGLYGELPEFASSHEGEAVLLRTELKAVVAKYGGREASKMGVANNGLCLLMGYCLEILMERSIREVLG